MEIYLVGGAVRDELLGLPVKERDWVVVGASPKELLALGYQPVGKDFPVFLHPETHEEYALARTERKTAKGYKGFRFYAASDVSLEKDLLRRDLTINAIAKDSEGNLIDPYGGKQDLQQKWLRHVSEAFAEDPVRILRVARLASKLVDFKVHPDTNRLMQQMVENGEVEALVAERVWQELSRGLQTQKPTRFFEVLEDCGALSILFPEITDVHSAKQTLARAVQLTEEAPVRFAALLFGVDSKAIKQFVKRYRIPRDYADLAALLSVWYPAYQTADKADAQTLWKIVKGVDGIRRPERFQLFLLAAQACDQTPSDECVRQLECALKAMCSVDTQPLQQRELVGEEFANEIRKLQIAAVGRCLE